MFTGIIEDVGRVERVSRIGDGLRLRIAASFSAELRTDESVSINGACQTVVEASADYFEVISIEETLRKTNLGSLRDGSIVNLERAMRSGDRLDGHIVQGHVDSTGVIAAIAPESTSTLYRIRFAPAFAPYVIPVGSIAVDGISLTVARLDEDELTVAIIPHTMEKTAISRNWRRGGTVNLEFDLLGKYVIRWLQLGRDRPGRSELGAGTGGISEEMLRSSGF